MRGKVRYRHVSTPAGSLHLGDVVDSDVHPISEETIADLLERDVLEETNEEPSELDLSELTSPTSSSTSEEYDGPSARELYDEVEQEVVEEEGIPEAPESPEANSVGAIKGVGEATQVKLEEAGYHTVGDVLAADEEAFEDVDLPPSLSPERLVENAALYVSDEKEIEVEEGE